MTINKHWVLMNRWFSRLPQQFPYYWRLMRFHKPVGTLLLLWPTLWGLWLAAEGVPDIKILLIFVLGVIVMRAAGCVINDFADRNIDGQIKRTRDRPLATGVVSEREALNLFFALLVIAFLLVLMTNKLTVLMSFGAVALASLYPFMKRYTHMPQVVLGAAFSWSIPMGFSAQIGQVPEAAWVVYIAALVWIVVYDAFYAMVDRDDDLIAGVKSIAILFGDADRAMTSALQLIVLWGLYLVGERFELGWPYWLSVVIAAGLFIYQQYLIRNRDREQCFKAFVNNSWVGAVIFAGIATSYWLSAPVS